MSEDLRQKIEAFLEKHHLSKAAFEKNAGLKPSVVKNILNGYTKHPREETLNAIAAYMGCDLNNLVGEKTLFSPFASQNFSAKIENPDLLCEILTFLLQEAASQKYTLTMIQTFTLAQEAYEYALEKENDAPQVDRDFITWRLKRLGK